jgi:putative transposase
LFRHHLDEAALDEIRETVNKGLVLGSERFKSEIEANLERRVRPGKVGRKAKKEMLL